MTRCNIGHVKNNADRIFPTISNVSPISLEGGVLEVRVNLDHPGFPGAPLAKGGCVSRESDKIQVLCAPENPAAESKHISSWKPRDRAIWLGGVSQHSGQGGKECQFEGLSATAGSSWTEFFGKGQLFCRRISISTLGRCSCVG